MFAPEHYQLIDFGDGRKLERFGQFVLDRPAPAAVGYEKQDNTKWQRAAARYDRPDGERGEWTPDGSLPESWLVTHGHLQLELKPTPFGHLGVFPEQAANWDWIARQMAGRATPLRVLNLFAYTGGSTLAAAGAGAHVVHVDAARNIVAWARRNAELSQLSDAPIRWICEDAMKFARREEKRGNRYDAVILDPPSYGRGPGGEVWKLAEDLSDLLEICGQLLSDAPAFFLLSCHSAGMCSDELARMTVQQTFSGRADGVTSAELTLRDSSGRDLNCGVAVRWQGDR